MRERGLAAVLFLPKHQKPLPAVIVLGGSGGGLSESRAELLASQGYAALALAYFGLEDLPSKLERIPLEYFETALEWLKSQGGIDSSRIGLWGTSRGAELSLLLGTLFPEKIQAIAAYVPSSALYSSIHDSESPAWTYRGEPLAPNAPFPELILDPKEGSAPEAAIALTPFFLEGMRDEEAFESARIPVEKIECPVLLVSGQDDRMWPSDLFARQISERIKAPCLHLSYPGAGHRLSPSKTTDRTELHPVAKLWFDLGGNAEDNARARADSWEKTLAFFSNYLSINTSL